MASRRRQRVTFSQLETLWEFLNSYKEIATGYNKSAQDREYSRRLWESVAEVLNSHGEGAEKDWKGWSNYWVDYKAKIKKRAAVLRASENSTSGNPSDVAVLTLLENKFLGLLGDGFGNGLPIIPVDPFQVSPETSNNMVASDAGTIHSHAIEQLELLPTPHEIPQEEPQELQSHPSNNAMEPPPVAQPERRRRRRIRETLSQEAARHALVKLSRERLQQETQNGHTWEQILTTLKRIAGTLDRIAGGPHSRNEDSPNS